MNESESREELTGEVRHEPPGVNVRLLLLTTLGLVGLTLGALGIVSLLFSTEGSPPASESSQRAAQSAAVSAPLDVNQRSHRVNYEAGQRRLLENYGWVDRQSGVARIPIDRAMRLIVEGQQATP